MPRSLLIDDVIDQAISHARRLIQIQTALIDDPNSQVLHAHLREARDILTKIARDLDQLLQMGGLDPLQEGDSLRALDMIRRRLQGAT